MTISIERKKSIMEARKRLLVVDDEPSNARLLKELLGSAGYEVTTAGDGVEALKKATRDRFDVIISDGLMPRMDGFQLCRKIKASKELGTIPFIFYSGTYVDAKDEELALSLGADKFVAKPAQSDVLIGIVGEVIRSYEMETTLPVLPEIDGDPIFLQEYNKRLFEKLEKKVSDLEKEVAERKLAENEIVHRNRELAALHAIAATISRSLDLQEMLHSTLVTMLEVMDMDSGFIALTEAGQDGLSLGASQGLSTEFQAAIAGIKIGEGLAGLVIESGSPVYVENLWAESRVYLKDAVKTEGLKSFVGVALKVHDKIIGALCAMNREQKQIPLYEIQLLDTIGEQIGLGIQNARLFKEARSQAIHDGLTGLYNHRYFHERLEEEIFRTQRYGGECALIMLDLDNFKRYNDLFGHLAGDEVLKRVGHLLRKATREVDISCRYGGEEFAVILPQTGISGAQQVAERLRQTIQNAFASGESIIITASLGVACWPSAGLSRRELIYQADLALLDAKQNGRNQTSLVSNVPVTVASTEKRERAGVYQDAAEMNTIYALAAIVDARDHYSHSSHSRNVSQHAVEIGRACGLSRKMMERLRVAARLHDIGKIGLPDSIIKKPTSLDQTERERMKGHSELGATIAGNAPGLADCALVIRHHHEWYDGTGYPDGIAGEAIPLEARIIAIADAYDTMTTPRTYRRTVSHQDAMEELKRHTGTQFDPHLVDIFAQMRKGR